MQDPSAATMTPPNGLPVVPDVPPWCALEAGPESAHLAREHTRAVLADDDADTTETVALIVSELVTNAVIHGPDDYTPPPGTAPPILLSVQPEARWILIAVRDPWPGIPLTARATEEDESGRGLKLIRDLGAIRWTEVHVNGAKTVYALLLREGCTLAPGELWRLRRS